MPGAERKKGASGSPVKEVSQVRDFFKSRSFKVLAGVVLVLLGVVLFTAATGRSFLSSLMGFVTTPVQQISSQAAGGSRGAQWKDHRGAGGGKRRAEGEA
jgi:hypothetical protein